MSSFSPNIYSAGETMTSSSSSSGMHLIGPTHQMMRNVSTAWFLSHQAGAEKKGTAPPLFPLKMIHWCVTVGVEQHHKAFDRKM